MKPSVTSTSTMARESSRSNVPLAAEERGPRRPPTPWPARACRRGVHAGQGRGPQAVPRGRPKRTRGVTNRLPLSPASSTTRARPPIAPPARGPEPAVITSPGTSVEAARRSRDSAVQERRIEEQVEGRRSRGSPRGGCGQVAGGVPHLLGDLRHVRVAVVAPDDGLERDREGAPGPRGPPEREAAPPSHPAPDPRRPPTTATAARSEHLGARGDVLRHARARPPGG